MTKNINEKLGEKIAKTLVSSLEGQAKICEESISVLLENNVNDECLEQYKNKFSKDLKDLSTKYKITLNFITKETPFENSEEYFKKIEAFNNYKFKINV